MTDRDAMTTDVEGGRPGAVLADALLTAHFAHIEPCTGEPCRCHYFQDLATIRAALDQPCHADVLLELANA
jgi:hypothetical protein